MSAKFFELNRMTSQDSDEYQGVPSMLVGGVWSGRSFQRSSWKVRMDFV